METQKLEKILEIKVDVGQAIQGIADLNKIIDEQRAYQKSLREEIKRMTEAEGENSDTVIELQNAYVLSQQKVKDYQSQVAGLSKTVQNQLKIEREQIGSNTQLRAQLSNLTKAYDELSKEEREAAQGVELKNKINEVTDALKNSEEATQRYYRNVGNYENAIKNSLGLNSKFANTLKQVNENGVGATLNEMSQGVKNVGKETTKLLMNPIIATLAAIAAAVMAVVKGIKSSEENTAKWSATMAKFKPFLDLVTVACQKFAGVILDIIGGIGKATGAVMKWLEKFPIIGDKMKEINAESERYIKLAEETYQIDVDRRKLEESAADAALKVSELRTKAKDKERYSDEQRLKFVQEANEVERKIAEEKVALAERELKAAEEEAKATQNQKEVEEKLSQLRIAVKNERQAYFDKSRELLEQENTIKNEIAANDKARAEESKKTNEQRLADQEKYNAELDQTIRDTEDMLIELLEEGAIKEEELERTRYERQIQAIQDKQSAYDEDSEIYNVYQQQLELAAQQHAANMERISLEQRNKEVEAAEAAAAEQKRIAEEEIAHEIELQRLKLSSYQSIANSISAILEVTAGDNKKRLKAAKVLALAEVTLNQGMAIADAVKAAGSYPFPINLVTIAASVAGAMAAIAPAIQAVNSVKLARGGRVTGAGTSTSDSIPAMLSNGEFVVNAKATTMFPDLLETINNLGLGIATPARAETVVQRRQENDSRDSLIKALREMPAPVVSVEEIDRTGKKVKAVENLSRLL